MQDARSVLVIGAGIAGATAAHRLSQAGLHVHLIDKEPTIGGRVVDMGCKATDVCLRCNVCVANELLRTVVASREININTRTQLSKLETGTNGSKYIATLEHEASFIDRSKCKGCMACITACPEKCILAPKLSSSALPVIDYSQCRLASGKKCSACEQACPFDAINMQDKNSQSQIDIDSVVIATGHEPYNPAENSSYGYGRAQNIITGTEAEQQLATSGKITRPSDGQAPKRIAFIQCVGSRTEEIFRRPEDTDYCSTVCCSYALRIARLIKHQNEDAEVTVFYMDIQNFGKGFDDFYKKCKDNMTFIRSRPYEVKPGQNVTVNVKFAPQSPDEEAATEVCEQEFDLVVLAVGIRPRPDTIKLAEKLLLPLDEQGFLGFKNASALPALQQEGIYVAGTCESPKDIKSSMTQAEAISAAIISEVS
jgi:heterodisulfide reductase subunit A